jgi:tRNA threonylcarbamoyladenosine biosynthesis protein TsaB
VMAVVGGASGAVVIACEVGVAESLAELGPRVMREPTAEDALGLAMRRIERGEFDDLATVDANYVRRTDAEIFAKPAATAR